MSALVLLALRLIMALALYAFLGWAFINLWRELRNQGALLATRLVPPISVTIVYADHPPEIKHFNQPEITLGRDPTCDCPLDEETVSAHHARLSYHHGQWWLEDLASTNGTFLNQERLSIPTVVTSDDEIACGSARLTIDLAGD